jgi:hypothetical protein
MFESLPETITNGRLRSLENIEEMNTTGEIGRHQEFTCDSKTNRLTGCRGSKSICTTTCDMYNISCIS